MRGALKGKTVVLVTHQVDFLHNADLILVMRDGEIVQSGKYNQLLHDGTDFSALVAAHDHSMELVERSAVTARKANAATVNPSDKPHEQNHAETDKDFTEIPKKRKGTAKLIDEEQRATGRVGWRVYKAYATEAWGWWGVFAVLFSSLAWQLFGVAGDYWLAFETSGENAASFNPSVFIRVYAIISGVAIVLMVIRTVIATALGLDTAQIFFRRMIDGILHAPMFFFDTTPSGRILSRVSFCTVSETQTNMRAGVLR